MKPHSPDFCNKGGVWKHLTLWPREFNYVLTWVCIGTHLCRTDRYRPLWMCVHAHRLHFFTFCLCAWIWADSPDVDWLFSCGSWLTNPRRPSSPCGSGLGEVGQLFYSEFSLTCNLYISSKWARLVVFSAWFGAIATTITLFGLDSQGLAEGMVSHSTLHTL